MIIRVGGVDLGTKHDRSAFAVLEADPGARRVRYVAGQSFGVRAGRNEIDLREVRAAIADANKALDVARWFFDPSQAILLAQDLRRAGVRMVEYSFASPKNLDAMVTALLTAFRNKVIDIWRDQQLIEDLGKLDIADRGLQGQKLIANSDRTGHADLGIAFCIALPVALHYAMRPRREGPVGRLAISGVGQVLNSAGQFQTLDHAERVVLQRARQLRGPQVF